MEQIPKTISDTIDVLATKFGTVGTHLWEILVKGKFAESLTYSILGVIAIVIAYFLLRIAYKEAKKNYEEANVGLMVTGSTVGIILAILGMMFICFNLVGVFAPEYAMLTSLIK